MLQWELVVIVVIVVGGTVLAWLDARATNQAAARDTTLEVAVTVAASPAVVDALDADDPSATLQPYAERVRLATGTDFVVVMSRDAVRYSHPNPANIGRRFRGHTEPALAGRSFTEEVTGTLGPSVRAVVPVSDTDGSVIGLVAVGITEQRLDRAVLEALPRILGAATVVGLLGAIGAWMTSRRLRQQTHGLGEHEITRMYEYYEAVLRAVREGLLLLDRDDRLTLMNREAQRLLGLGDDAIGRTLNDLDLADAIGAVEASGEDVVDAVHVVGDRVLVVNRAPAHWADRHVGSVVTLRDHTELQDITTQLDNVRGLAEALRSQSHEAANRLHTMVSLIEIGRPDEAVDFATSGLALSRQLADLLTESIDEPVVEAVLLGKSALASERGVTLEVESGSRVSGLPFSSSEAVTILSNLLDNAIDAAQGSTHRRVRVNIQADPLRWRVEVGDSGPGIPANQRDLVLTRGWSTKTDPGGRHGLGLDLVAQLVRRHNGQLSIGASELLGGARFTVDIERRP